MPFLSGVMQSLAFAWALYVIHLSILLFFPLPPILMCGGCVAAFLQCSMSWIRMGINFMMARSSTELNR